MKYVLVTGSNGGMGKSTVQLLKKEGFFVFALDLKKGIDEENIMNIECDVTNEDSIRCAYEKISKITDSLFGIIHFAGIYKMNSLVEIEKSDFEQIFKINVFGAYLINKIFVPLLNRNSRIIITTSELATLDPLPFTGLYGITKSTLDKYAFSLKMELQLLGIYVSVLRAGAVKTSMLGVSTNELDNFCNNTKLYSCNAGRFKKIVNNVETKNIDAYKLSKKIVKILNKKHPKFAYAINRNFLLKLLNLLPSKLQFWIIKKVLK